MEDLTPAMTQGLLDKIAKCIDVLGNIISEKYIPRLETDKYLGIERLESLAAETEIEDPLFSESEARCSARIGSDGSMVFRTPSGEFSACEFRIFSPGGGIAVSDEDIMANPALASALLLLIKGWPELERIFDERLEDMYASPEAKLEATLDDFLERYRKNEKGGRG